LKLVLLLFALMLAIGVATLWIWRSSPEEAPCDTKELAQERSPDGRVQADVFEVHCGAAITTHVALRNAGAPVAARSDVLVAMDAVRLGVIWSGERQISVESGTARVLAQETRWRDVQVKIGRSR